MYSTISRISGKQSGVAFSGYHGNEQRKWDPKTENARVKSTGDNISLTNGSEVLLEEAGQFIEETQC